MGSDGDNRFSRLRIVIETTPEIQTKPSPNNNKKKIKNTVPLSGRGGAITKLVMGGERER